MLEGLCVFGDKIFWAGSELFEPVQDADRNFFAADGAFSAIFFRLLRSEAKTAVPMSVQMILPLLSVQAGLTRLSRPSQK